MSFGPDISINISEEQKHLVLQDPELVKLIEGCLANDRSSQEMLYRRFYGKMMSLCMRYVSNRDDAMSILNLGFLKVFKSLGSYTYSGSFDGWVHRIVYHSIIDQLRKDIKQMKTEVIDDHEASATVEGNGLQTLLADDLYKLLDQLPEMTRLVFNMFAMEGYKHEEIGQMLGISEGTSKWHVNNARNILKTIIEKNHLKS